MKINRLKLAKIISLRLAKNQPVKKLSRQVAAYLLENGQTSQLASLIRDVQADRAGRGQVEIIAERAYPLPNEIKAELKDIGRIFQPRAKTVEITEIDQPEVVGGIRLKTADQQLDLSLAHKVAQLKAGSKGTI